MRGVGSTQTTAKQSTEQTRNSINSERQPISIGISAKSSMEPDLRSSLQQSALTQVLEPLPASIKVDWFYLDPQNQIQGPFSQENMRLWNEGGYFRRDLPIKLSHWTSFYQFAVVFQDLKSAFNFVPPEPGIPRLNETSVAAQHLINSKVAHRSLEDQSQIVRITEEKQVAPQVTQQQTTDLERTKTAHVLSTVASTISSENDTTLVVEKENSKVSATVDAVTPDESALKTLDTISLDKTMESKNKSAKMKEEQEKRVTKKSDSKKGTSSGTVNDSVSNKNRKQDSDPQPKLVQEEISQKVCFAKILLCFV